MRSLLQNTPLIRANMISYVTLNEMYANAFHTDTSNRRKRKENFRFEMFSIKPISNFPPRTDFMRKHCRSVSIQQTDDQSSEACTANLCRNNLVIDILLIFQPLVDTVHTKSYVSIFFQVQIIIE